ncbi:MAG: T9SS type A sorting domain-containing protein [Bacteroidetes bacterium]|nr:T9SS type A sorting domain-containing protein [Bacteroidota bacterium]
MIKRVYAFTAILLALCVHAISGTSITDSIISGGIYRSYILYVPAIYNSSHATPLVINMHGYGSNMQQQQLYGNFMPIADTANFLVVHPQGTYNSGQAFWNAGISPALVNDVQFISDLIDSLKLQYNIDLTSVYATGMSNGGFMSHTLACSLNNRIAAIASVTGSIFNTQYTTCVPNRVVPVMQIHGTADGTVPYGGGSGMEPIDTVISFWRRNAGCNATASFSNVPNTNTTDGCTAEHYLYNGGINGATIEFYKIIGGGHSWPGAPVNINVTNMDFNASVEIWRFFRKYKLNQFVAGIEPVNELEHQVRVFPNPSASFIRVESEGMPLTSVELRDLSGRVLAVQTGMTLDLSGYSSGIYFLKIYSNHNFIVKKVVRD